MTFLLGRQATLGHDPPIIDRSTTTDFWPILARFQARIFPASPLPITRFWQCSTVILILRYSAPDHSGSVLHATLMIRIAIVDDYQNAAALAILLSSACRAAAGGRSA